MCILSLKVSLFPLCDAAEKLYVLQLSAVVAENGRLLRLWLRSCGLLRVYSQHLMSGNKLYLRSVLRESNNEFV